MARAVEFDEAQAVEKAMHVFWRQGYANTSMRDLTEAMQINSSSLYNTLGDKRQLFIRALTHYTSTRRRAFEQYQRLAASPFQVLETFMLDAVASITTEPSACLCLRTAFEQQGGDPAVQAALVADDELTQQFLQSLVEGAQRSREIAPDEDAGLLAQHLNSLFAGWYNAYLVHRDRTRIQRLAAYALRQLRR